MGFESDDVEDDEFELPSIFENGSFDDAALLVENSEAENEDDASQAHMNQASFYIVHSFFSVSSCVGGRSRGARDARGRCGLATRDAKSDHGKKIPPLEASPLAWAWF